MPNKVAVMVYLGDYYGQYTIYPSLHFAYKNVYDFIEKLSSNGWIVHPPIPNQDATREYCINYLNEKIEELQEDDWFLFYYVGHADQFISGDVFDNYPVYMVTSLFNTGANPDDPNSYFVDTIYGEVVQKFKSKAPNGHLITVLDCCYALGLINNYSSESDFHTVFAASNGNDKAAYKENSFFFKSFKKAWNSNSFMHMKRIVENSMRTDYSGYSYVNFCQIQIATNFQDQIF